MNGLKCHLGEYILFTDAHPRKKHKFYKIYKASMPERIGKNRDVNRLPIDGREKHSIFADCNCCRSGNY